MQEPSFDTIYSMLLELIDDLSLRENVADWAQQYVENDDLIFKNEKSWDLIMILSGIDIKVSSDEYLYNENDFEIWLNEFAP